MKSNKWIILFLSAIVSLCLYACSSSKEASASPSANPPAPGFDQSHSDAKAIQIADEVMNAVGGRKNWDDSHFLRWTFFGSRTLVWDKWGNRVRIESHRRNMRILLDMNSMKGKVWLDGQEAVEEDTIQKYLQKGKEMWINDSYWLFMPFKLKDSGVTLKYLGQKPNELGINSDVLQLTFNNVGVTPENKYLIYVNPSSHLVTQWEYYPKASDEKPQIISPWQDYRPYGKIVLSVSRGTDRAITNIAVFDMLPDSVFTSFRDVDWYQIASPKKKK